MDAATGAAESDDAAEGPWALPEGWCWTKVGLIANLRGEKVAPKSQPALPFVGMDDIEPNGTTITRTKPFGSMKSAGNRFYAGDVLYGRLRPYLNKTAVTSSEGACSGELLAICPSAAADCRYLQLFMHSRQFVNAAMSSVSGDRPRIDFATIAEFDFPLPPLAEQSRIVARVDAFFAEIAEGEAALADVRKGLENFRRALLKAAVTGELTKDWRASNPVAEAAHERLTDIETKGADVSSSKSRARRNATVKPLDISSLPELPAGWVWSKLGNLTISGPTNGYSPKKSADGSGTLSLKLTATTKGQIDLSDKAVKSLSEIIMPGSDLFLKPNDLLFQRGNTREYVGIAAVYDGPRDKFVYPDLMIRVRTATTIMTEWIWRVANSPFGRKYMMDRATGTAGTMPKINGEILRNFPIPIPPLYEITEILRRISDALAASVDTLARLDAETSDAERLKQSILKAAFEGRLLPQDSVDEPANELLARVPANSLEASVKRARTRKSIL